MSKKYKMVVFAATNCHQSRDHMDIELDEEDMAKLKEIPRESWDDFAWSHLGGEQGFWDLLSEGGCYIEEVE